MSKQQGQKRKLGIVVGDSIALRQVGEGRKKSACRKNSAYRARLNIFLFVNLLRQVQN